VCLGFNLHLLHRLQQANRTAPAACSGPGKGKPKTAEQLMRSRYSAYFFRLVDDLVVTSILDNIPPKDILTP
jgi:uncharacterized protein YchJ